MDDCCIWKATKSLPFILTTASVRRHVDPFGALVPIGCPVPENKNSLGNGSTKPRLPKGWAHRFFPVLQYDAWSLYGLITHRLDQAQEASPQKPADPVAELSETAAGGIPSCCNKRVTH